jgi:hypothetical protein
MADGRSSRVSEADVHPLVGFVSADESARLIRNYRYAVERMMRILGGWIALTPELSAKLLFGRHVWDCAQHADLLGKRLPELRARAQVSEPANAEFAAFMDAIEQPEGRGQTIERLVGIYHVLKPHLLAAYEAHQRRVNQVYEPPTQKILARMIEDERRHVLAGRVIILHLSGGTALGDRARAWQAQLEPLLARARGVTGAGLPEPAALDAPTPGQMLNDDAHQFIRLERPVTRWPMPEALDDAVRALADALLSGNVEAARRWLTSTADVDDGVATALAQLAPQAHHVVALARIGQKRAVKIRIEGRVGAATLLTRWASTDGGWRAELLELARVDPALTA